MMQGMPGKRPEGRIFTRVLAGLALFFSPARLPRPCSRETRGRHGPRGLRHRGALGERRGRVEAADRAPAGQLREPHPGVHGRGLVPPLRQRLREQPLDAPARDRGELDGDEELEDGWGWQRVTAVRAGASDLTASLRYRAPDDGEPGRPHGRSASTCRARSGRGRRSSSRSSGKPQLPRVRRRTGYKDDFLLHGAVVPEARRVRGRARLELPPVPRQHRVLRRLRHVRRHARPARASTRARSAPRASIVDAARAQRRPRRDALRRAVAAPTRSASTRPASGPLVHDFAWTADPRLRASSRPPSTTTSGRERFADEVELAQRALGPDEDLRLRDVDVTRADPARARGPGRAPLRRDLRRALLLRPVVRRVPLRARHRRRSGLGRRRGRRHGVPDALHLRHAPLHAPGHALARERHRARVRPPVLVRPGRQQRVRGRLARRGLQLVHRRRGRCCARYGDEPRHDRLLARALRRRRAGAAARRRRRSASALAARSIPLLRARLRARRRCVRRASLDWWRDQPLLSLRARSATDPRWNDRVALPARSRHATRSTPPAGSTSTARATARTATRARRSRCARSKAWSGASASCAACATTRDAGATAIPTPTTSSRPSRRAPASTWPGTSRSSSAAPGRSTGGSTSSSSASRASAASCRVPGSALQRGSAARRAGARGAARSRRPEPPPEDRRPAAERRADVAEEDSADERPWRAEVLIVRRGELCLPLDVELALRRRLDRAPRLVARGAARGGAGCALDHAGAEEARGRACSIPTAPASSTRTCRTTVVRRGRPRWRPVRWAERVLHRYLHLLHWQAGFGG